MELRLLYLISGLLAPLLACGAANAQSQVPVATKPLAAAPSGKELAEKARAEKTLETNYINSLFYKYGVLRPIGVPPPPEIVAAMEAAGDGRDENGKPRWLDGNTGMYALFAVISRLLEGQKFEDIERLLQDWNNPAERNADGRWKLMAFRVALESVFAQVAEWDHFGRMIERWKERHPNSVSAALAEAIYWKIYAWDARGFGNANSVSDLGWQLFRQRLGKAETALLQSKPYAAANPVWYEIYLSMHSTLGWEKSKVFELASEAAGRHKYYFGHYFQIAELSTPGAGGSWELLDAFIAASTRFTQDLEGKTVYARLYWHISQLGGPNFDLFQDSRANWSEMRAGFQDMMQRYPHSVWNANNFAAFACRANDGKTFNEMLPRIKGKIVHDAWPSNYSFDLCMNKFAKGALHAAP